MIPISRVSEIKIKIENQVRDFGIYLFDDLIATSSVTEFVKSFKMKTKKYFSKTTVNGEQLFSFKNPSDSVKLVNEKITNYIINI